MEKNFNNMASEGYSGSPQKRHSTEPGGGGRGELLGGATPKQGLDSRRLSGNCQAHGGGGEEESILSLA